MSTDYSVVKSADCSKEIFITEHSGVFDVSFNDLDGEEVVDVAVRIDVEQLAEVGLRFLQAALYNCADVDKMRKWLHARVNEVDCSGKVTRLAEIE